MVDVEHPQENDFILAIADHLNAEPTLCRCGHPSVLHTPRVGCVAVPWGEGPPCECYDAEGRPPCRCGHFLAEHTDRVGCTARWEHDSGSDVCPCEVGKYRPAGPDPRLEGAAEASPCSGARPDAEPLVLTDEERDLILLIRREQGRLDAAADYALLATSDLSGSAEDEQSEDVMTEEFLEAAAGEAFRVFALEFRKGVGRPMTAEEWAVAEWAHTVGVTDGVLLVARMADLEGEGS